MTRDEVRALLARDWGAVAAAKAAHWEAVHEAEGVETIFRIGDVLRRQGRELHPGWPTAEDRRQDREAHERLASALRRAAARWPR